MDLSFIRRAEARFASRSAAHPDFGMLVAALAARAAASPAVQALASAAAAPAITDPLVELLLGRPAWRRARALRRGAFHPALARQRAVNRSERDVYRPVSAFLQRAGLEAGRGEQNG